MRVRYITMVNTLRPEQNGPECVGVFPCAFYQWKVLFIFCFNFTEVCSVSPLLGYPDGHQGSGAAEMQHQCVNTLRPRQMGAISQTTFSNSFS